MHLVFPKKKLFELLGCSINTLRTIVSAGELKLQKNICNIMDLEVNQKIYESHLGDGVMDKCVKWTLDRNILVPADTLYCNVAVYNESYLDYFTRKIYQSLLDDVPGGLKIGKFNMREKAIILDNSDTMTNELFSQDKKEEITRELLFGNLEDLYLTEKRNILGLMFSQKLPVLRLPCNVFHQVRLPTANREPFNAEEDETIKKYMETTTSPTPYADLEKILGINVKSLHNRYQLILKHEDKTANYQQYYTNEESAKIMKAVFDVNKNVLEDNNIVPSADVWKELGDELNKRPQNIYCHWREYIHPTLVRYEAGVLFVDFKETLINYMVDNNIMRRNIQTYLKVK